MNEFEKQLEAELKGEGVSDTELKELIDLRNKVIKVSDIHRSDAFKRSFLQKLEKSRIHEQIFIPRRLFTPSFLLALLMFVLIAGVVSAQNSLPGQPLYPVKILSEDIIKTVNPSFKDEILKRRSEEIKTLTQKKSSGELNKTIDKYEKGIQENKTVDPIKIEQSRRNLEDARDNSEDGDKKEIEHIIIQTENKINRSRRDENENKNEDVKGTRTKVNAEDNRGEHRDNNNEDKRD